MAFDRTKLSGNLGAGSNAPKVFTFVDSSSTVTQIDTDDYFLSAYEVFEAGDVIIATGSDGSKLLVVTAASSTTVTTAGIGIGAAGLASFDGAITNLTVVNGIVTAAS